MISRLLFVRSANGRRTEEGEKEGRQAGRREEKKEGGREVVGRHVITSHFISPQLLRAQSQSVRPFGGLKITVRPRPPRQLNSIGGGVNETG